MLNKKFFAKGKRGFIHTAMLGKKKIAIKSKNPRSEAHGRMLNEGAMMKRLNKIGVGPNLIKYDDKEVMYEFVEGKMILDWIESSKGKEIKKVLFNVLDQCFRMDSICIVKEEMTRPVKHILVTKKGPVMIDFERAHFTKKPHNVTQFVQFLTSSLLTPLLRSKGIFIRINDARELSGTYKKSLSKRHFEEIKRLIHLRTPFQTEVLHKVASVPKGKVTTYQDIAHAIGTGASRAVGTAISKNPCAPFDIPCHRVVNSDGRMGGYSGLEHHKEDLLDSEGIKVKDGKIKDFVKKRHKF